MEILVRIVFMRIIENIKRMIFLIDLFKENRFVGIEIEGTVYHYTYDQIVQIGLRKQRLRS